MPEVNEDTVTDPLREAKDTLDTVTFAHGDTAGSYSDYALAQATVALAEEQRTANMIAMLEQLPSHQGREILHDQIVARLGLA